MNHNIFLIGFMGSGKSYWGHIWALEKGYTFYDLDTEIENSFELPVELIFEKHGEEKFREMERSLLRGRGIYTQMPILSSQDIMEIMPLQK